MREEEFRSWLEANGANTSAGRNTRVHAVKTIEKKLSELGFDYPDLESAWQADRFGDVREAITELRADFDSGGTQFRILMPDSEMPRSRLSNWRSWLAQYGRFLSGDQPVSDADRIRQYVLEHYIEPSRESGAEFAELVVKDVNDALGLNDAWPNICQAMRGRKFFELADVPPPQRFGADMSTATRFRFDLETENYWALRILQQHFGEPSARSKKIAAFELVDARQIALDLEAARAQVWIEGAVVANFLHSGSIQEYAPQQPRNSNLPSRLRHNAEHPNRASLVVVANSDELNALLDLYRAGNVMLDSGNLSILRERFLETFGGFMEQGGFAGHSGFHEATGDRATRTFIEALGALDVANSKWDTVELGREALSHLLVPITRGILLRHDMHRNLELRRQQFPGVLEEAVGRLLQNPVPAEREAAFAEIVFDPVFQNDGTNPFSDVRTIGTVLAAGAYPGETLPVQYTPLQKAYRLLCDRKLFSDAVPTRAEFENANALGSALFKAMQEWGWNPRDMWDVHNFIKVTCKEQTDQTRQKAEANKDAVMQPTNLILYGPPGTGKTYRTALEAVRLCDGWVDYPDNRDGREALMRRYRELVDSRQVEMVTFHQSFSYEEFIEGLRPDTEGSAEAGGFNLKAESGLFQRIADRAQRPVKRGDNRVGLDGRAVFKMSLGQANDPHSAWVFEESIEQGCAIFGFRDVDWSDPRFVNRDAILEELQNRFPAERVTGQMGMVKSTNYFRNDLKKGDIIIASMGLNAYRAAGIVDGDYEYAPRSGGGYCHRRKVNWLWHDPSGQPVGDLVKGARFSMETIYPLPLERLNLGLLDQLLNGADAQPGDELQFAEGELLPHVIIIDEINRANVSKVFGELITLIETDKRLCMPNALTVRLPYSKREFGVPANLHIIGTMNTADRSIALLDTALRRRFRFEEMAPDTSVPAFRDAEQSTGLPLAPVLDTMNKRIEYLVDRDHRIGHAFFIGCKTKDDVDAVMRDKVIPLLQEYFFDDWSRLAAVLGEKDKGGNFLDCEKLHDPMGEGRDPIKSWRVRKHFDKEAYHRLISATAAASTEAESEA